MRKDLIKSFFRLLIMESVWLSNQQVALSYSNRTTRILSSIHPKLK
jgi:hypothetical protein